MIDITDLPIFTGFNEIQNALKESVNLTLKSPTGSGKSVGLPLLLLREKLINGQILVVQPRRIAARLLAKRVARILGTQVGEVVGYQVRFENKISSESKIIYLTDGILLKKILNDPLLSRVGLVIFDEFHERSIQMDATLAMLKRIQSTQRPSLRLIITSATLSISSIRKYLGKSKSVELSARIYPVKIEYRSIKAGQLHAKVIASEVRKCIVNYEGDILIFAAGVFEIFKIINEIQSASWSRGFLIKALYGEMKIDDQELALKSSPKRKIIVSTNIAETSLTVEGVRIVIDTGIAKKFSYDPIRGVNVLLPQPISKSSADQRAGRAGRNSPGYCLRLWGEKEHDSRDEMEEPAINRLDITEIYLNICSSNINPCKLDWLNLPPVQSIEKAKSALVNIGALSSTFEITEKGRQICKFPLHPRLGMALLVAKELDCLPALALLIALVDDRSPIIHKDFNAVEVNSFISEYHGKIFSKTNSDLRLLLGSWAFARNEGYSSDRCKYYGIHANRCKEAEKLARRFCEIAGYHDFKFKFPNMKGLEEVLLIAFPHHLARIKNRGTMIFESLEGFNMHISKHSEVQCADWVIGLDILEKPIKGKIGLEMLYVSEVKEETVQKVFCSKIENKEEVVLQPTTRSVIRSTFSQLGKLKFNLKEVESLSKEDRQKAYSAELLSGNLKLKKWDIGVERFLNRIAFMTKNYPEYEIKQFDEEKKVFCLMKFARTPKVGKKFVTEKFYHV